MENLRSKPSETSDKGDERVLAAEVTPGVAFRFQNLDRMDAVFTVFSKRPPSRSTP